MKLEQIGVLDLATDPRITMGEAVPFFFYRYLSLFAVADATGGAAKQALFKGGHKVGMQLVKEMMYRDMKAIGDHYRQNGMGILELLPDEGGVARVKLLECATCSGLPRVDMALCWFDGGILAGAMQALAKSNQLYRAREIECCGLGNNACLFEIGPNIVDAEE